MTLLDVVRTTKRQLCWVVVVIMVVTIEVSSLNGPNVCVVKQKYNITKRVKYRAPMSVRTYEWCMALPPRCTKWSTEMRDLTKLETEERTAEVSVCCPGYKMKDVSCVPICPSGKMGPGCSEDCPADKWGPNCINACRACAERSSCSATTGECRCQDGWQGERCQISMATATTATVGSVLTTISETKPTPPASPAEITTKSTIASTVSSTTQTVLMTPITSTTNPTTTNPDKTTILPKLPSETTTNQNTVPPTSSTSIKQQTLALTERNSVMVHSIMQPHDVKSVDSKANTAITIPWTMTTYKPVTEVTGPKYYFTDSVYNRTEIPVQTTAASKMITQSTAVRDKNTLPTITKATLNTISTTRAVSTTSASPKETTSTIATRKLEPSIKMTSATTKVKPKEIWIKPAQKGDSPIIESKVKIISENLNVRQKSETREEPASIVTTPRTIIVSIIPTSVSYSTFKKIALTTATYIWQKQNTTRLMNNSQIGLAKSSVSSPSVFKEKPLNLFPLNSMNNTTINPLYLKNVTKSHSISFTKVLTSSPQSEKNVINTSTQSMMNEAKVKPNVLTTAAISSNNSFRTTKELNKAHEALSARSTTTKLTTTVTSPLPETTISVSTTASTEHQYVNKTITTPVQRNIKVQSAKVNANVTDELSNFNQSIMKKELNSYFIKNITNDARNKTSVLTEDPRNDEETFHILTEPEHITAVMGEKEKERSSLDLLSVISIAGGLMMTIITIAVVIVMFERCKRPSYDDVRKLNDMRMQVMIDNNDVPPPYVRSIFHTPLPDPPVLEKGHYQPISTLDRNLKQFMRPVIVQNISPIMLENFRDILECHYDHLPKRKHENCGTDIRCSGAPSMTCCEELRSLRASATDSAIEEFKFEAKMEMIDSSTSEPLYAEIPCWRPATGHVAETINVNGEAVTEL